MIIANKNSYIGKINPIIKMYLNNTYKLNITILFKVHKLKNHNDIAIKWRKTAEVINSFVYIVLII